MIRIGGHAADRQSPLMFVSALARLRRGTRERPVATKSAKDGHALTAREAFNDRCRQTPRAQEALSSAKLKMAVDFRRLFIAVDRGQITNYETTAVGKKRA